jgi:F-type H+-transporting ATPase subunit delta
MSDNAYAAAIVALAEGLGDLDVVDNELTTVARAVNGSREMQERLSDINIPPSVRLKFVESEALSAAHPTTRAALAMVIAGEAASSIGEISDLVSDEAARRRDASVAEVTVAQPIDDASAERLRTALERKLGRKLTLKVTVDPSVVGGVRARVGDTVIDGSLSGRLSEVRTRLAG